MLHNKSRKRNLRESNEFKPLSKGKLFESDDESDPKYDWGFKKSDKYSQQKPTINAKRSKVAEDREIVDKKMIYHKTIKPYEIKNDNEREMFMENLAKVYERSYIYHPCFYNLEGLDEIIDHMFDQAQITWINDEIKKISELINNFWNPLNESYIVTKRLSENCAAYKMIEKCLKLYTNMKKLYENALEKGETEYKSELNAWVKKDVDTNTKAFQITIGNTLLKYKDSPEVTFERMAKKSKISIFLSMVKDDIVKTRGQKVIGTRKGQIEDDEAEESIVAQESEKPTDNRPASKALIENKGLVPRRKKANANPRVKHRMKFKKALVRYHSQVPRTRDDAGNYEGEQSGIRAAVIKSKKFK